MSSSREADKCHDDPLDDENNEFDKEEWLLENVFQCDDNDKWTWSGGGDRVMFLCWSRTLSLQTQKHVTIEGQFRALFVRDCGINNRCTASVNV